MTDLERELIRSYMKKAITEEQFLNNFTENVQTNSVYMLKLLKLAYKENNEKDVDYLLFVVCAFNLITEEYIGLLCKLMNSTWHHSHEDIASIFQAFRFPQTVECLYKTALTQFEYLEYDEAFALAVKCIWALGDINTPESRDKLKLLAQSENEIIKRNAIDQLNRSHK